MLRFLLSLCAEKTLNRVTDKEKKSAIAAINEMIGIFKSTEEAEDMDEGVMRHVLGLVENIIEEGDPMAFDLIRYNIKAYVVAKDDDEPAASAPAPPASAPPASKEKEDN